MVKFVSLLLVHLVLETIHPVEESQVNVKDLNISGQARGETTDETGLLMISEITSCLYSDDHLNQSQIFAGNEFVIFIFLNVGILIVNPEGLRNQYYMSPLCFSLTIQ